MYFRLKSMPVVLALILLTSAAAHAGLLITDSADPVEAKHVEVELNGSYAGDRNRSSGVTTETTTTAGDITVTTGLLKGLDIAVGIPYTFRSRVKTNKSLVSSSEGFQDITVDLKYQFMELAGLKLAIKPGVILPTGDMHAGLSDGHAGFAVALHATREFAEGKFLLHGNAGYVSHNYKDVAVKNFTHEEVFNASIACEAEVAEGLKLGLDTGLATSADKKDNTPPAYVLTGANYEFSKLLDGYAGVKIGLNKPETDVTALFGVKLKF